MTIEIYCEFCRRWHEPIADRCPGCGYALVVKRMKPQEHQKRELRDNQLELEKRERLRAGQGDVTLELAIGLADGLILSERGRRAAIIEHRRPRR